MTEDKNTKPDEKKDVEIQPPKLMSLEQYLCNTNRISVKPPLNVPTTALSQRRNSTSIQKNFFEALFSSTTIIQDIDVIHQLLEFVIEESKNWGMNHTIADLIIHSMDELMLLLNYRRQKKQSTTELSKTMLEKINPESEPKKKKRWFNKK